MFCTPSVHPTVVLLRFEHNIFAHNIGVP